MVLRVKGGKLQEDLDNLNILYSGSNSMACRNTWNKRLAKEILKKIILERQFGLKLNSPKQLLIMGFVCHLMTGSDLFSIYFSNQRKMAHIDIFKISDEDSLRAAYKKCTNPNRGFLFEEYIHGREITVTIIDKMFPAYRNNHKK